MDTVGAVVSEKVIAAFALASVAALFPAMSEIKPAATSIVSLLELFVLSVPAAAKPDVLSRLVFAVDVSVSVNVVAFVTTADEKSDAWKLTFAVVVSSPSMSQLSLEKSR